MTYVRALDPFPLESADHTRLHEVYARLGEGRLCTTRCAGCGATAWPPRGFCPACTSDRFEWVDLPDHGVIHGFTVQETGLPAGFDGPRVFAIVKVDRHRIFAIVRGGDPAAVAIGQPVKLAPLRVADDPWGNARWLPAFVPA